MLLRTPVVGVTFENRQGHLAVLRELGITQVELVAEPENPHDPNAVKVMAWTDGLFRWGMHVGYLPRELAAKVAPVLEKVKVVESAVVGTNLLGMRLVLEVPDDMPWEEERAVKDDVWDNRGDICLCGHLPERRCGSDETWTAVAFRIRQAGDVWVMVGRGQECWAFRAGQAVPKGLMRRSDGELQQAMAAVRKALEGEAAEVAGMGEARALYLKATGLEPAAQRR